MKQQIDDDFYRTLPEGTGFTSAFDSSLYRPVPEHWIVAATDVTNSTVAIEAGRYKDVNIAGAVGTIAIANHIGSLDFPFFFGGDGMVFMLPGDVLEAVLALLTDTKEMVKTTSGLELRAGVVPVSELYRHGADLEIGRIRITDRYVQAVARGTGMEMVDRMLKGDSGGSMFFAGEGTPIAQEEPRTRRVRANFNGFSCRWQDIPSSRGETLSLIVQAGADPGSSLEAAQKRIFAAIEDAGHSHPLTVETQTTRARGLGARAEARFRSRGRGLLYIILRVMIWIEVTMVRFVVWTKLPIRAMGKKLNTVRADNIENSDVRKLDGTLKMVVAVSPAEREKIVAELQHLHETTGLLYGYHVSDRAVMTCLIHTNHENEVHFVDAADGGYAMAARMLKKQKAETKDL